MVVTVTALGVVAINVAQTYYCTVYWHCHCVVSNYSYSDCHLVVALLSPVMVPHAFQVQPIWHGQEGYSVVVLGVAIFTEQLTVS